MKIIHITFLGTEAVSHSKSAVYSLHGRVIVCALP